MKYLNVTVMSVLILSCNGLATIYNIGPGDDFGNLILTNTDTLFMTGGEGHNLNMGGWSTAIIEDTSTPLTGPFDGGIWELNTASYSELTISGGEFNDLNVHHESLVHLSGGQILNSLTVFNDTAWVHIYGHGFNNDPFGGSPLTGFWADDTAFSINLVDSTISTYDQIIFHEIPEPVSILLFGLGGFLIRRYS